MSLDMLTSGHPSINKTNFAYLAPDCHNSQWQHGVTKEIGYWKDRFKQEQSATPHSGQFQGTGLCQGRDGWEFSGVYNMRVLSREGDRAFLHLLTLGSSVGESTNAPSFCQQWACVLHSDVLYFLLLVLRDIWQLTHQTLVVFSGVRGSTKVQRSKL